MRKLTLGLALGAVLALVLATTAYGEVPSTYTVEATGSPKAGTKKAPQSFSGTWTLRSNAGTSRPASPYSWAWGWEGVTVNNKGFAVCTSAAVNNAGSEAVCPAGSKIGQGTKLSASLGPAADPTIFQACDGKVINQYNGGPGLLTWVIDGPAALCAGVGFLGAVDVILATSGGKTTMTWNIPNNISHPLPGVAGSLPEGVLEYPVVKAAAKSAISSLASSSKKKKAKKHAFLESTGKCTGERDFTFTVVDDFGAHTSAATTGKCKKVEPPKKK